jgi:hypothetical protein
MNPETWAYIHHLFFAEKLPKRLIARKLGMDVKTIRRALKKNTFSQGRATPRGSKLDAFKGQIQDLLKKYPGISGVRIGQEIKKIGYAGGISILHDYLRTQRPAPKAFLHIQTLPAEEAWVDWAYARHDPGGTTPTNTASLVLSLQPALPEFFQSWKTSPPPCLSFPERVPKKIRTTTCPAWYSR